MTMTSPQQTMTDAARRSQEALTRAVRIWVDSLDKFTPTSHVRWHSAAEVVDAMFDFADHMLASQREFTKVLVAATTSVAAKAASATQHVAKDMQDVAKEAAPTRDGATASSPNNCE